jgi:MoaA/NifB/PqqE/SkfB family radical SAM enzyme
MKSAISLPTDMCIIVTYRCPMQCQMCNIWQNPTDQHQEITPMEMERLPKVKFINITGGEPFVREDLEEIVEVANLPVLLYLLRDGLKNESFVWPRNFLK